MLLDLAIQTYPDIAPNIARYIARAMVRRFHPRRHPGIPSSYTFTLFSPFFSLRAISRSVIITDSDRILWLAVINLALDDLIATKDPLKRSARAWFLSID